MAGDISFPLYRPHPTVCFSLLNRNVFFSATVVQLSRFPGVRFEGFLFARSAFVRSRFYYQALTNRVTVHFSLVL